MRAFTCPVCRHLVTFESTECLHCGTWLAFDWDAREIVRLGFECANRGLIACNGEGEGLCAACRLTRTRPPDDALAQWATAEAAKRRLVFELLELGLPLGEGGLAFDLLSSAVGAGHHRPRRRRHHARPRRGRPGRPRAAPHAAPRAVPHAARPHAPRGRPLLPADPRARGLGGARALPRADGRRARRTTRRRWSATTPSGPPADWAERFVSAYATMHPWEDWAETFAHYLHIRDVLQTAVAYGITRLRPGGGRGRRGAAVLLSRRRGRRTSARCSRPGSRSPTRSTRSAAASARTISTRSCSRPGRSRSWRSSTSSSG